MRPKEALGRPVWKGVFATQKAGMAFQAWCLTHSNWCAALSSRTQAVDLQI